MQYYFNEEYRVEKKKGKNVFYKKNGNQTRANCYNVSDDGI